MPLIKRNYIDGETVITAQNLNDIQDAVLALEEGLFTVDSERNGTVIAITDAAKRSFRSFNIYGKTTQAGTPTPAAPVALVSAGGSGNVSVTVARKNLLPCSATSVTSRGITFSVASDGTVLVNGTATDNAYLQIGKVNLSPGKYFLSGDLSGSSGMHRIFITNGTNEYNNYTTSREFEVTEGGSWTVSILINKGASVSNVTFYPMVRHASVADSFYEPYMVETLTISTPNGLPGIPVSSGGNYIDTNGQRWICDEIDFYRSVYIQRIGIVKYNANTTNAPELGQTSITGKNRWLIARDGEKSAASNLFTSLLCNVTTYGSADDTYVCKNSVANGISGAVYLYLDDLSGMTAEQALAWLKEKQVEVQYILATAIETPLSEEELKAYAALHAHKENTTVFNSGHAFMELEYVMDAKKYIDSLQTNSGVGRIVNISLPAAKWTGSGNLYYQVVSVSGITANSQVNLTPTVEQMAIFYEKDITFVTENDNGVVTVYVIGQKPQNDYTIPANIVEVRT